MQKETGRFRAGADQRPERHVQPPGGLREAAEAEQAD